MSRPLCLASCFLTLNEENTRWWLRIQDELDLRGIDFVLLTSNSPADSRLRNILLPLWLQGFGQAYGEADASITLEAPLANALINRDHNWLGHQDQSAPESSVGLAACQSILRNLLNELQPSLVLVWGSSLGQSVVLQQLAIQQGRPCWVIERGMFPDTLMIELAGQGGQTELNWSFNLQNTWRTWSDSGLFPAAKELFCSHRSTKYAQAEFLEPELFHQRHNPERKKLVALLLQHDASSCLVPENFTGARIHSPVFKSCADAIAHLSTAARELDCRLIVKPHPVDQTDYSKYCDEHVSVTRDVNLHSVIGAADVVAAMTSTSQFEALLHEKPLLLLARSALADKGIAYEARSAAELARSLKTALERDDFSTRAANARRFVCFLLQNYSVSLSDQIPAGATLRDLCRFLAQNAVAEIPGRTLEDRLTSANHCLIPGACNTRKVTATNGIQNSPGTKNGTSIALHSLPGPHRLEVYPVETHTAFECLYQAKLGNLLRDQQRLSPDTQKPFTLPGYCAVCSSEQNFMTDFLYASADGNGRLQPSWRERQICQCGLNSRQRACFHVLADGLGLAESAMIYCTEQLGPLFKKIRQHFPFTLGSEFLGDAVPPGESDARGIRNEDLTRLTFPDDAFDAVMSLEVLEHVPDYRAALAELARCLKPGGKLLLTTPIHFNKETTVVRASFGSDGKLTHHLSPVYHGDPINSGGALCFNDFGWDLLDEIKQAGFTGAALHFFTSQEYGYLGLQCVVLATRQAVLTNRSSRRARPRAVTPKQRPQPRPAAIAETTEMLQQRAEKLLAQQQWLEAGELFQILTNRLPNDLSCWRGRLECSRELGHEVMAELILEEALENHPEWAEQLTAPAQTSLVTP